MSPARRKPAKEPPAPVLSASETEFNRWMEHLDLDGLDLERLKRHTEALGDKPDDEVQETSSA